MSATCRRHDTECRRLGKKTTRRHPTCGAKLGSTSTRLSCLEGCVPQYENKKNEVKRTYITQRSIKRKNKRGETCTGCRANTPVLTQTSCLRLIALAYPCISFELRSSMGNNIDFSFTSSTRTVTESVLSLNDWWTCIPMISRKKIQLRCHSTKKMFTY